VADEFGNPMGYLGVRPTMPADIGIPEVSSGRVQEGIGGPRMPQMPGLSAGQQSAPQRIAMPALRGGGILAQAQPLASQTTKALAAAQGASGAPPMAGPQNRVMQARAGRVAQSRFR